MNENTLSVMVERYTGMTLMAGTVDVQCSVTENGEIFNDDQNHSKKSFGGTRVGTQGFALVL
jgi:hypothetical protein